MNKPERPPETTGEPVDWREGDVGPEPSESPAAPARTVRVPLMQRWRAHPVVDLWNGASNNLRATIMTLVSIVLFSAVLASIKYLGSQLPMTQILLIRQLVVSLVIFYLIRGRIRQALHTTRLKLQIMRGVFSWGSQLTQFIALLYVPLAEVTALSFSQVVFITIGAGFILGERVGWHRWFATAAGFVGLFIMLAPTGEGMNAYALMALASGVLGAGVSLTIRAMADRESTLTIMLYQCGILCLAYIGPALWYWTWPTAEEWGILFLIGLLGALAQYLFTRGCQIGEAAAIAPLEFTRLLLAATAGYLVFFEVPSLLTLTGAVIIIGSMIYTVRYNR